MKARVWLLLTLCPSVAAGQEAPPPPRLVVVMVIDQFRPAYLQQFRPFFGRGGFNLFLRRGAWFTQAEYRHAVTLTCPGHAVILSGRHANMNGIISNQWYDVRSRSPMYCAADTSVTLLGSSNPGRSPRNLIGPTVGDGLKQSGAGRSRIITVAGKDRSAIMLGGHLADAAYWMEGWHFVTSTHYMARLPGWVDEFNAAERGRSYAGRSWDRLLPRQAYAIEGPDNVPAEENVGGMGRTFPHQLPADSARFVDAFSSSPFANEVLFEFAMAAVSREQLGQDQDPDLLGLSLSANDLVGHAYGPNSHEVMDLTVRTDRQLERFFTFLDREIGLQNVLIVLTADHGVAPLPELVRDVNAAAGRLDPRVIADSVERALTSRYGKASKSGWMINLSSPWVYLNLEELARKGIAVEEAERVAASAARRVRGVHQALTATELRAQLARGTASSAVLSFHPERSGNVYYELQPYVVPGREPSGTTHGSPWSYDARVPLLWFGASVKRGRYSRPVSIADIAPTLSAVLGVEPPAGSQGGVLPEVWR